MTAEDETRNEIAEFEDMKGLRRLAQVMGRKGGRSRSPAKIRASSENIKKAQAARREKHENRAVNTEA